MTILAMFFEAPLSQVTSVVKERVILKGLKPGWVGSRDFRLNEFKIHKMCFFYEKHVTSLRRMAELETKQELFTLLVVV